jgi:opacity protein-like surface antigen
MSNAQFRFVIAVFFSCLTKVTFAAGLTSFVAVGLGNTTAEVNSPSGQVTASGSGYRLVAGNQVSQLFSVETEYVDFGQFANSTSKIAAKGLGISGVLTMPLTSMFSIYGRAGYARIETTSTPLAGSVATPLSDTMAGLTLGYGIQIDLAPNASLRLSWDRYKSSTLADSFTDRVDMNSSGLLIFRF